MLLRHRECPLWVWSECSMRMQQDGARLACRYRHVYESRGKVAELSRLLSTTKTLWTWVTLSLGDFQHVSFLPPANERKNKCRDIRQEDDATTYLSISKHFVRFFWRDMGTQSFHAVVQLWFINSAAVIHIKSLEDFLDGIECFLWRTKIKIRI